MQTNKATDMLKALAPTIGVGVLTANLMKLGDELSALDGTGVGVLHFDVMDGCFCPSMTFGPSFVRGVKTSLLKDVHLMIADPLNKVADYVAAGADILTVHVESEPTHIHRIFQALGKMTNANDPDRGIVRGVAINPGTPLEVLEPLLDDIEMVTLLAINPGWGGQKFIPSTRGSPGQGSRCDREQGHPAMCRWRHYPRQYRRNRVDGSRSGHNGQCRVRWQGSNPECDIYA